MKKQWIAIFLCLSLLATGLLGLTGCAAKVQADDLMKGITPEKTSGRAADDAFKNGAADFAVRLFQTTWEEGKNSLISPLSVMLALSMTANGAKGETLAQMEALLGGDIPIGELNEYLHAYVGSLPSSEKAKLTLANSIWFKDSGFTVEEDFLQRNADYYGAAAYKSAFDEKTLRDINNWVKENTDGVIDKIVDQMDPYAAMYLVNTVLFDAEWQNIYRKHEVRDGTFTAIDGAKRTVSMMCSNESLYLDDGKATGFLKPYNNGYSFAALLPNEGVALDDYIASLTGEGFLTTVKNAKEVPVEAAMPKFSYDYGIEMSDALKALGMTVPFDAALADFPASDTRPTATFISAVCSTRHISPWTKRAQRRARQPRLRRLPQGFGKIGAVLSLTGRSSMPSSIMPPGCPYSSAQSRTFRNSLDSSGSL